MASGSEIAKAYVQIMPSTKGMKANLTNAFKQVDTSSAGKDSGNSFVSGFSSVLGGLGTATLSAVSAASAGVIALTKEAVNSFADYEQLVGGMETLYKENADLMVEYASEAYKTAGLSANEYMETATAFSASLLASTGGDTKRAADAANQAIIDMSDNYNKMGTSMESIQNAYRGFAKQNYTMLDNLSLGYGGTKKEMERLLEDAEKLSGVEYNIENLEDVYSAIHVIQQEMGITGTTALEAGETISGSAGSMSAAWKNLVTGLADDNANFEELINNLVSSTTVAMNNLVPRITQSFKGIGKLISELAPVFAQMLPEMVSSFLPPLLEAATTLVMAIVQNLPTIIQPIIQELPVVVDMIISVLPDFISAILEMLPLFIDAGMQMLTSLILGIAESLPIIIPQLVDVIGQIVDILIQNAPLLIDAAMLLIQNLGNGLIQALPQLVAMLPQIINGIISFFNQAMPMLIQIGVELLTALIKEMPTIVSQIEAALPQIIDGLTTFFISSLPLMIDAGIKLFMAIIENLPQIIDGIVQHMPEIVDAITKAFMECQDQIIECGFTLLVALVQNLPLILAEIVVALNELIQGMLEVFAHAFVDFVDVGANLIKGIGDGIGGAVDWLLGIVNQLCTDVWNKIADFFDVHSPSRKMIWLGQMLDEGLAGGIDEYSSTAMQSALGMTEDIMGAFDGMNADLNGQLEKSLSVSGTAQLNMNSSESNAQLLNMLSQYLPVIAEKEMSVSLEGDASNLFSAVQKQAKIYSNQNGRAAFA